MRFIKKYWAGVFSLPISYWLISLSVNITCFVLMFLITRFLEGSTSFDPLKIFITLAMSYSIIGLITIWQVVGVTRSAVNHINNPSKTKVWGYLAIIFIFIGCVQTYFTYQETVFPQFKQLYKIAILDDPDLPPYKITIGYNGEELIVEGGIKKGLLNDLKEALLLAPAVKTINLDSIGGRIGEAEDLYNYLSKKDYNTVTNKKCHSACVIVLAAGKKRWVGINGRVALHSAKFIGISNEEVNATLDTVRMKMQKEKGIPPSFFKKGDQISPEKLWFPSLDELLENNLITSKFSPATSSLISMESSLKEGTKALRESLPKALDKETMLIKLNVKLNRIISTHTISERLENILKTRSGRIAMERVIIKNTCKSKAVRNALGIGVIYEYIYIHSKKKNILASFELTNC